MLLPPTDNIIHPALFDKLLSLKDTLSYSGTIFWRKEKKRKPRLRLRVRVFSPELGCKKMLGINIPDEATADAVNQLLNVWRAEHAARQEAIKRSAEALAASRRRERQEERLMLRMVAEMAGGSSWTKRRVRKEFSQALKHGPIASALYVLGKEYLRHPRDRVRERGRGVGLDDAALFKPADIRAELMRVRNARHWRGELAAGPSICGFRSAQIVA